MSNGAKLEATESVAVIHECSRAVSVRNYDNKLRLMTGGTKL
jgi:hypothetical protein